MRLLLLCCAIFLSSCFIKQRIKDTIEDRVYYMYYYFPDSLTSYLNDSINNYYSSEIK